MAPGAYAGSAWSPTETQLRGCAKSSGSGAGSLMNGWPRLAISPAAWRFTLSSGEAVTGGSMPQTQTTATSATTNQSAPHQSPTDGRGSRARQSRSEAIPDTILRRRVYHRGWVAATAIHSCADCGRRRADPHASLGEPQMQMLARDVEG